MDLGSESEEPLETSIEAFRIGLVELPVWKMQRRLMKALEDVEHRTILVLEQALRDVHDIVGRNADEIVVERAMVDRAQAQAVAHGRGAANLQITNDVRCI